MKKCFEPIIQMLFLALSVAGSVIQSDAYRSTDVYEELFLTNIINAVVVAVYLAVRLILRHKNQLEPLQRGMLLYLIYSCLPVFFLINTMLVKILSVVCFSGGLGLLIIKNLDVLHHAWSGRELKKKFRMIISIPLFAFGAGFLARGINMIVLYNRNAANVTELFASISDILISIIWIPVAIGVIRKSAFGISNVFACYIQARACLQNVKY